MDQSARASAPSPLASEAVLALSAFLRRSREGLSSTVQGKSMGETLCSGTRVRIRFADLQSIRPDDVVVFARNNQIIAHRVVCRGGGAAQNYLITRGDAGVLCDVPVRAADVIGVVAAIESSSGSLPLPAAERRGWRRWAAALVAVSLQTLLRWSPALATRVSHALLRSRRNWQKRTSGDQARLSLST